jgi:hypothetical protein
MNTEQQIAELERKVEELTNKVSNLYDTYKFPLEVKDALVANGFLQHYETLIYEGGAGGNLFTSILVKYLDKLSLVAIGQKLTAFSVNTSTDTCYAFGHNLSDGQTVSFYSTDTLPGGLDSLIVTYTIVNATVETFQVDNGSGTVNITTNGVGVQYVQPY